MVRHSLVFDGLIIASGALLATGISAAATPELNGPTMASSLVFEIICWTFWVPLVGSCLPLTASSNGTNFSVKPLRLPACSTAKAAPYWVGSPLEASAPEVGRSLPMSISPLLPFPPPPPEPQAKATKAAAMRTPSPLARTVWFPLVLVGRHMRKTTPNASHHLPPSSQRAYVGARVRRRRVRPHGVAELLLRSKLSTCRAPQVKSDLSSGRVQ